MNTPSSIRAAVVLLAGLFLAAGCAKTGETAERDALTANVGNYGPPPPGLVKAKVGVPKFQVQADASIGGKEQELEQLAADQMSSLLHLTGRFEVIERAQIQQVTDEQNMEGIVRPDQMAKAGQVEGVDYLLIGKVTNFRVKKTEVKRGLDVGGGLLGGMLAGSSGFSKKDQNITTECGVDIRLVDPTTGKTAASHFGEFKRTDSAGAMGINIAGFGTNSDADMQIDQDNAGKILRLAFDDAVRKMLPEIDQKLQERATGRDANEGKSVTVGGEDDAYGDVPDTAGDASDDAAAADVVDDNSASEGANGADQPAADKKFCSQCGGAVAAGVKFCPKCGAKVAQQ